MDDDFVNDPEYIESHQYRMDFHEIMECIERNRFTIDEARTKKDNKMYTLVFEGIVKELKEYCTIIDESQIRAILESQLHI